MENIFMDAMSTEKKQEFEAIKKNKAFALKLHEHLDKIYYTHHRITDETGSVQICMKTSPSYNYHGAFGFNVTKDGVTFFIWNYLIFDTEKFNEKHNGFLTELLKHPQSRNWSGSSYHLYMDINENEPKLNEKLKFILSMMEGKYNKRF